MGVAVVELVAGGATHVGTGVALGFRAGQPITLVCGAAQVPVASYAVERDDGSVKPAFVAQVARESPCCVWQMSVSAVPFETEGDENVVIGRRWAATYLVAAVAGHGGAVLALPAVSVVQGAAGLEEKRVSGHAIGIHG